MSDIERGDWIRFASENGIVTGCVLFTPTPCDTNNWKQIYVTDAGNVEKKHVYEVRKADGRIIVY